jgi:hypothetical protein
LGLASALERMSAAAPAVEVIRKCHRFMGVAPWFLL